MAEFLLEIGCEEIPAGWLDELTKDLHRVLPAHAMRANLQPETAELTTHSTPRRLVARMPVLTRQLDLEERVFGPAIEGAQDTAIEGFAKKGRIPRDQLDEWDKLGKDGVSRRHYGYLRKTEGRPAVEVLPGVIAASLRALSFPKRMSWDAWLDDGKGPFPFGRPIRWLVALLDGVVVPFQVHELANGAKGGVIVESGDTTHGHRFFPRGKGGETARVRSFADLQARLQERCVLLSRADRQAAIRRDLKAVLGEMASDHGLLEDWADLVEHPAVVIGQVPGEFQTLPREVLETVLVHHQKYIPLLADGRTVSRFAAVTDTDGASGAAIVRGMERVVVARLRDAAFFLKEDLKRPLLDRVADLAGVTFHAKLGSYKDKAERLVRLVDAIASEKGLLTKPQHEAAREAALLAKADLTTLMVREFTELQGVMGGIYLRSQNAPPSVAAAVEWHYHPLSIEERAPPAGQFTPDQARVFATVALADKLDTLAGYFGIGESPTGSRDPFGLRRAAHGVIRILLDFWQSDVAKCPSLSVLVGEAVKGYEKAFEAEAVNLANVIELFLLDRLGYVLEARGFPSDEVRAVLHPEDDHPGPAFAKGPFKIQALDNVLDAHDRLKALHRVRAEAPEDFASLAVAFKRAKNILEQAVKENILHPKVASPNLLEADAERALYHTVSELGSQNGSCEERLRALATLKDPVARFFDAETGVFVMVKDREDLRSNRLALLEQMRNLFYRIADISKLGG